MNGAKKLKVIKKRNVIFLKRKQKKKGQEMLFGERESEGREK